MDIIAHLSTSTPVSFNSLQKSTGLSATNLALALVELGGKVAVHEGGLVIAPEPVVAPRSNGPRGPTAKVAPRLEACKVALLDMARRPEGVNAKELLGVAGESFIYTDILLIARTLLEEGRIQESRKGRKATWTISG